MIKKPVFCVTADADWCSDFCLKYFVESMNSFDIVPTIFATNKSDYLSKKYLEGNLDIGHHPNFLEGSTHGDDYISVINHMFSLFPFVKKFRSHSFYEHNHILREMKKRGIEYDSNINLFLQENIFPLRHGTGITKLPIFWEDDIHYKDNFCSWESSDYMELFFSPGLKILNCHPFNYITNIPDDKFYKKIKPNIPTLDSKTLESVKFKGQGVQTFFNDLLSEIKQRGYVFDTLDDIYDNYGKS